MGTSYKALLRAFVITSTYLSLFWTSREVHAGPNELSGNRFALLSPPIVVSLVGNLATAPSCFTREVHTETLALFIVFGLIGKGIHTCRRTFEFNDIWSSATLRSDSYVLLLREYQLTSFPRDFLVLFTPH